MDKSIINTELKFKAVRSSGSGGQHVNKVATKVELSFDVQNSKGLTDEERERLLTKWENKLTKEGILKVKSQATRSQLKNKEKALKKFWKKLDKAFEKKKKRKPSKPSKQQKEKRLKDKRLQAEKKDRRKKIEY